MKEKNEYARKATATHHLHFLLGKLGLGSWHKTAAAREGFIRSYLQKKYKGIGE